MNEEQDGMNTAISGSPPQRHWSTSWFFASIKALLVFFAIYLITSLGVWISAELGFSKKGGEPGLLRWAHMLFVFAGFTLTGISAMLALAAMALCSMFGKQNSIGNS